MFLNIKAVQAMKGLRAQKISDIVKYPQQSFEISSLAVRTETYSTCETSFPLENENSDDDTDPPSDEDLASEDLESRHAACAALTVVFLVFLFVSEFLLMSVYLVLFNG